MIKTLSKNSSFIPSTIDIPVSKGDETNYLPKLELGLNELLKSGATDIAIVVNGADPFEKDELQSSKDLNLNLEQLKKEIY